MGVLARKLWRTILSTKGQFLAMTAVFMVGAAMYISIDTAYLNLQRSVDNFYRTNNFADYYFHVVRAPAEITRRIETMPGVVRATGRIQKDTPVLRENEQRATARLTGYPLPMQNQVNRLHLLSGRLFEKNPGGSIEVLVDPQYARANGIKQNDTITIVAEGRLVALTVVGTATGPEFIYPMQDASSLMPEPESFGIVMLPQNQLQQVLNLSGQINQVAVQLAPGTDAEEIAARIESILEPYGNLASYPRKQQLSHAVLQGEVDSLRSTSRSLPLIFLGVAAAIQFVMLGRMVKTQRQQIGIMKALGYHNRKIMLHYAGYAMAVAVTGALLGSGLGLLFASGMSAAYARFFNLPQTIGGINLVSITFGFILSAAVAALAGFTAARGVTRINPAESMRPEPPRGAGRIFLEGWLWLWRKLAPAWRMSLRTVVRNRLRSLVTLAGVTVAVGMLVVSVFTFDAVDYILERHFFQEQRYDYLLRFTGPVKETELLFISRLEGVLAAEPFFELPVKIHYRDSSEDDLLMGLNPGSELKHPFSESGTPLSVPGEGVIISSRTADKLGVRVGDSVEVETRLGIGPTRRAAVKVTGINRQLVGNVSYVSLAQANRMLHEQGLATGAMLKTDPGEAGTIERALNDMTGISSVLSRQKELDSFYQNLDSMLYFISIMIIFAVILGFAIVYNSSAISFSERRRELASMLVLGFTGRELSGLLLKENLLQSLPGVLLGLPCGYLMALGYLRAVETDLYSLPLVIYPRTYVFSALIGLFFIAVAHLLATRGIKKLDMVEVLKNRD